MLPAAIVETALFNEINLIAITDHNASYNAAPVIKVGSRKDCWCCLGWNWKPTRKSLHCLFRYTDQLNAFRKLLTQTFRFYPNNEELFGSQWGRG